MKFPIYLDNHATTPVDPRVLEAMLPYLTEHFGNPSSHGHLFGWKAEEAVEVAREQTALLINAEPREILFTSGATESNNLALKGAAARYRNRGGHIVTCATEHKAVLDTCRTLQEHGSEVTCLPVGPDGRIDLQRLREAFRPDTVIVSIMAANNEIGTLQPIAEIGALCRQREVLFHTDAVQAAGRVPLDVEAMNIDLLSLTAHKIYGPKGAGALYVRQRGRKVRLTPLVDGGGQEQGMRPGTLNVPGIVGLGEALAIARREMPVESPWLLGLREKLRRAIFESLDGVHLNGSLEHRLPGNLNISIGEVEGESLVAALRDIAVSSGAACSSGSLEPSYVLKAIGLPDDLARRALRFGIGRFNTEEEIDYAATRLTAEVRRLREASPLHRMRSGTPDPPAR